jgi:phosphate starvation-inducible PhoH-like protein
LNAAPESSVDFGAEDNVRLAAVCGPLDENLHQIENRLGIEIRRRSGRFSLRGANAADGAAVLRQLYERAGGGSVTPEDVHLAIQENGMGARQAPDEDSVETLRGHIRGRGANQQQYLQAIRSHDLTFGIGPAGTGKTYLAVACAVEAMQRESVRRLVLVRPAVEAGERLGFLPGDLTQKVDPYLRPMYDALYEMIGFDRVARLIERNVIEVAPLAFMRGRTLNEAFIILDEAQNTTVEQIKMFLTRIGFGSRAVVTGDVTQTDLPAHRQSGLRHALDVLDGVKGIAVTRFTAKDVVRHPLVQRIVEAYERDSGQGGGEKA